MEIILFHIFPLKLYNNNNNIIFYNRQPIGLKVFNLLFQKSNYVFTDGGDKIRVIFGVLN